VKKCENLWLDSPFIGPLPIFRFSVLYTVSRTPWTGDQSIARTTQTQNKGAQTSMPQVGFEPTIPAFQWTKTVHASDRAATVIGRNEKCIPNTGSKIWGGSLFEKVRSGSMAQRRIRLRTFVNMIMNLGYKKTGIFLPIVINIGCPGFLLKLWRWITAIVLYIEWYETFKFGR
jgi:hypothetical protein